MIANSTFDDLMNIVQNTEIWPVLDKLRSTKSVSGWLADNIFCFWYYSDLFNSNMLKNRLEIGIH